MFKTIYPITIKYTYDPTHKGAPYTLDGERWMNAGELKEIERKAGAGLEATKDANGKWNECSDINETRTSLKSAGFTLATDCTGESLKEILDRYFAEVHSTNWEYLVLVDESLVAYEMNATEFRAFLEKFAKVNERKAARVKHESSALLHWLEMSAAA